MTLSGGRVDGVALADGSRIDADVVVSDADATHLYRDLVTSPLASAARSRLRRATPSLSGFVLLAINGRTPGLRHHTVLFPEDDAEFDAIFGRVASPVEEPTVYVAAPDDSALRPNDTCEAWFVLVNAPRHGSGPGCVDWDAAGLRDSYADRILAVMARRGLDVRDRVQGARSVLRPTSNA